MKVFHNVWIAVKGGTSQWFWNIDAAPGGARISIVKSKRRGGHRGLHWAFPQSLLWVLRIHWFYTACRLPIQSIDISGHGHNRIKKVSWYNLPLCRLEWLRLGLTLNPRLRHSACRSPCKGVLHDVCLQSFNSRIINEGLSPCLRNGKWRNNSATLKYWCCSGWGKSFYCEIQEGTQSSRPPSSISRCAGWWGVTGFTQPLPIQLTWNSHPRCNRRSILKRCFVVTARKGSIFYGIFPPRFW